MHWVYRCLKCNAVGSVPIEKGTDVEVAAENVALSHIQFIPHCDGKVEVFEVGREEVQ